ncbi:MAG: glycosyltransferase family 9 protein [Deltaproteobacteria bacterium]|nr:glycosyltransferase family 9 protein [Deltaproteobacteria bacterium]
MRKIDQVVGVPLCFFLSLWRMTFGRLAISRPVSSRAPQKILFIKLIEQGSTVLTYDTLHRAIQKVGAKNVYFWIFEENKPVLDLLEIIPPENVFSVRVKPLPFFFLDIFSSLIQIYRAHIDTVIDLEFYARAPAILSYFTGARIRVGCHRFTSEAPYRGDLMTHRVQYNAYIHTSRFFGMLLDAAYQNPNDTPLSKIPFSTAPMTLARFKPSESELSVLIKKLKAEHASIMEGPIVLLNANASDMIPLRKWEADRYIEVGKRVLRTWPKASVVFTGAPSERGPIDEIVKKFNSPRAISMAGKTTFRELLVLYSVSDVLVTNDSGPGHFSSMTDIYAITLFGPETPLLYSALGENKVSITAQLQCQPCVNVLNHRFSPCTNNRCMQEISVDKVYVEVERALRERERKLHATA